MRLKNKLHNCIFEAETSEGIRNQLSDSQIHFISCVKQIQTLYIFLKKMFSFF